MVTITVPLVNTDIAIVGRVHVFVIKGMKVLIVQDAPHHTQDSHHHICAIQKNYVLTIVVVQVNVITGQVNAIVSHIEKATIVGKNCVHAIILCVKHVTMCSVIYAQMDII